MENINELPQTVLIGFHVATFLLNTNRVLKAVELFKECLIILYNQAPKKEKEFVIRTFGNVIHLLMLNGYSHISDCTNAIECGRKLLVSHRESGERDKEGKVAFRLAELHLETM